MYVFFLSNDFSNKFYANIGLMLMTSAAACIHDYTYLMNDIILLCARLYEPHKIR